MNAHQSQLLQWVTGRLPADEAAELAWRVEADPALAAEARRLRARWLALELPPPSPAPVGFATRVVARALDERDSGLSWSIAPVWVRLASAAALIAGLGLGAAAGWRGASAPPELASELPPAASLADSYWEAFEAGDESAEVMR